jgi:2-iminobutanoate/2-iminopropanoate deaminase
MLMIKEKATMKREIIATGKAPAAVGPYSQGVRSGELIYTAGQIALDPASGKMIEGGVKEQTRQVLQNLTAVLEAAGSSRAQVVKTTVFLQDLGHFAEMNSVYAEFFPDRPPARSTIQVVALPLGALVEIEAVAVVGG